MRFAQEKKCAVCTGKVCIAHLEQEELKKETEKLMRWKLEFENLESDRTELIQQKDQMTAYDAG